MVISPITESSGPNTTGFGEALGAVTWSVFAPKSATWVDRLNGDFFTGRNTTSLYGIKDVPGLVRQGAVIPMRPRTDGSRTARAVKTLEELEFRIMPAEAFYTGSSFSSSGVAIDDDGLSRAYGDGQFTKTLCEYSYKPGTFDINVSQTGDFKGRPTKVTLRFSFPQLPPLVLQTKLNVDYLYDHDLLASCSQSTMLICPEDPCRCSSPSRLNIPVQTFATS